MIREALAKAIAGEDLARAEATAVMEEIMTGGATPAQIGGFLVALRLKGETADEIAGCAEVMRRHATRVGATGTVIDTCGTGGDEVGTFNISTAVALVAAGAGVKVAKHGNRSVSSSSGSADVLKTLGVNIDAEVPVVEKCLEEAGVGFLFAPRLHAAMKHAIGPRREMGVRTVFNVLGPLTNPAGASRQLLGVFSADLTELIGQVLARLGTERSLVVSALPVEGCGALDELSTIGPTRVTRVEGERVETGEIDAEELGIARAKIDELKVSCPAESAEAITGVLAGEKGPRRDIVMLNAAGAMIAAGKADEWPGALEVAAESIDSGKARAALEKLVEVSNG